MSSPAGDLDFTLRTARSTYVLFGAMFGALLSFSLLVTWVNRSAWPATALFATLLGSFVVWLNRFAIHVSGVGLDYRSLFGTWSLLWSDIREAEIRVGYIGYPYTDRFRPYVRLVITVDQAGGGLERVMNLKPFNREEIARFLKLPQLRLRHGDDVA